MPTRIIIYVLTIALWFLLTFVARLVMNDEAALVFFVMGMMVFVMFGISKFDYLLGADWK